MFSMQVSQHKYYVISCQSSAFLGKGSSVNYTFHQSLQIHSLWHVMHSCFSWWENLTNSSANNKYTFKIKTLIVKVNLYWTSFTLLKKALREWERERIICWHRFFSESRHQSWQIHSLRHFPQNLYSRLNLISSSASNKCTFNIDILIGKGNHVKLELHIFYRSGI